MTRNLTLLTDFYQLTMMNGYFSEGIGDKALSPTNFSIICGRLSLRVIFTPSARER